MSPLTPSPRPHRPLGLGLALLFTVFGSPATAARGLPTCDDRLACDRPSAWLPEPLEDSCLGSGPHHVVVSVSEPTGARMTATVELAGIVVGVGSVFPPVGGSPVMLRVAVNTLAVPEGRHRLRVHVQNHRGWAVELSPSDRVTVDRTPPVVSFGPQPAEGVCYSHPPGAPTWQVQDALDPSPEVEAQAYQDGCQRSLRVTATDACGNVVTATRSFLMAEPPQITIHGVPEGGQVMEARLTWEVVGALSCVSALVASLQRLQSGGGASPYVFGSLISQPGDYVLSLWAADCAGISRRFTRSFSVGPSLRAPTDLQGETGNGNFLSWDDTSFGHAGYAVQRRDSALIEAPQRPAPVGVSAPYFHNSGLRSLLNPSAQRLCVEAGFVGYAEYDIQGPLGGVHSWWTGSAWATSGNNSVFYMRNLVCKGAWAQIGQVEPDQPWFHDEAVVLDQVYDYRVRSFLGGQVSPWSAVVSIWTLLAVGLP